MWVILNDDSSAKGAAAALAALLAKDRDQFSSENEMTGLSHRLGIRTQVDICAVTGFARIPYCNSLKKLASFTDLENQM